MSQAFGKEKEDFWFSSKRLALGFTEHFYHLTQRHLLAVTSDEDEAVVGSVEQNFGQHAQHHAVITT